MGKFEVLSPEEVRRLRNEAVKKYDHEESDHPHVEPVKNSPVLVHLKSIFPFQIFPDELIVEEKRIVWIHRFGPKMCEVLTLLPNDINRIEASAGPLFGHLHISIPRHDVDILMERLSRKETFLARDLIDGLITAIKQGIEIKGDTAEEKADFLKKLVHVEI